MSIIYPVDSSAAGTRTPVRIHHRRCICRPNTRRTSDDEIVVELCCCRNDIDSTPESSFGSTNQSFRRTL